MVLKMRDEDRGVYREVYCPHCKRKYMDKVYYDYADEDDAEYAITMCTTCNRFMYARKGQLKGIDQNTEREIVSKWPDVAFILR